MVNRQHNCGSTHIIELDLLEGSESVDDRVAIFVQPPADLCLLSAGDKHIEVQVISCFRRVDLEVHGVPEAGARAAAAAAGSSGIQTQCGQQSSKTHCITDELSSPDERLLTFRTQRQDKSSRQPAGGKAAAPDR